MGRIRKDALMELGNAEIIAISEPNLPLNFTVFPNLKIRLDNQLP